MLATTTSTLGSVLLALNQTTAPVPPFLPTPAQLLQNAQLPAHALFTLHPHVARDTGAAVEHNVVDLTRADCAWMDAVYKAIHPDTGLDAEYKELLKSSKGPLWENACADEFGRLAQGNLPGLPTGTNTMHFMHRSDLPDGRKATYLKIVSADKPHKAIKERVRATVGGDCVDYPGETSTKTSDLVTVKLLLNSTISTPGALWMSNNIKDFYLNTPMGRYEYMRIQYEQIPDTIKQQYNLDSKVFYDKKGKGHVYIEIRKGMYGLPQAGRIANNRHVKRLAADGYTQSEHTPGLFRHATRDITFALVIDDFGVKYVGRENAQHLIDVLKKL
jgi:hypothetical protein